MNSLQKLIYAKVAAAGEVHHDKIVRMFPADRTVNEIHALYQANIVGLRSDGMLYAKN